MSCVRKRNGQAVGVSTGCYATELSKQLVHPHVEGTYGGDGTNMCLCELCSPSA